MKVYNTISILLLLLCSVSVTVSARNWQEFEKTISKDFRVNDDALIQIQNKYGNIEIVTSDRSTARFEVKIIVEAKNEGRANEMFDKIDVDFSASANNVSAITDYEQENNSWGWGKKNEKYQVHYYVQLPTNNELDLENKYGNVSVTDMNNDFQLSLKYGNANLQDIGGDFSGYLGYVGSCDVGTVGGDVSLDIAYSTLDIGTIGGDAEFTTKYSKMTIESVNELEIDSKYDKYDIGAALSIDNEGKYDNFTIGRVDVMEIETKYTHVRIDELTESGDFDTSYGGVKIKNLSANFESIIIDSGYTGFDIGVHGGFRLDIDTEYASTDLPSNMTTTYREKDSNELMLKGYYKNQNGGMIEADMRYGHLDITER